MRASSRSRGPRGRVGPGPRPGAERDLADEAGRGEPRAARGLRDLAEFLGVEANQLGGGPAVHGLLRGLEAARRSVPINEYFALGRPVLGRGTTSPLPHPAFGLASNEHAATRAPLLGNSPAWGSACPRRNAWKPP